MCFTVTVQGRTTTWKTGASEIVVTETASPTSRSHPEPSALKVKSRKKGGGRKRSKDKEENLVLLAKLKSTTPAEDIVRTEKLQKHLDDMKNGTQTEDRKNECFCYKCVTGFIL